MIKNKKGIFEISVNLLLNKATVRYDPNVIGPRSIIEEIDDLGFQADLILPNKSLDIKEISMKEFKNQKLKLIICVSLYLPSLYRLLRLSCRRTRYRVIQSSLTKQAYRGSMQSNYQTAHLSRRQQKKLHLHGFVEYDEARYL
jgi:hypothetical protein